VDNKKSYERSEMDEVKRRGQKVDYTQKDNIQDQRTMDSFAYNTDVKTNNLKELNDAKNFTDKVQGKLDTLDHNKQMNVYRTNHS